MQLRREQIVYRRVDELIPYVNNPRHNEDAVDGVAASIREFGFKVPMIVKTDGEIITGHTRILAAKKLGIDEVPTICADDLTDAQIKAFRLADNKVAEKSGWDFEKLEIELEGLDELGVDMSDFGFEDETVTTTAASGEGCEEYGADEFADNKFAHECPKCGFEFN